MLYCGRHRTYNIVGDIGTCYIVGDIVTCYIVGGKGTCYIVGYIFYSILWET